MLRYILLPLAVCGLALAVGAQDGGM